MTLPATVKMAIYRHVASCHSNRKAEAECELTIAATAILSALAAGYSVSVNDGEGTPIKSSTDAAAIVAALFSTDEDTLILHKRGERNAGVKLIYGNGADVISDYHVRIEAVLAQANALADRYQ